MEEELAKIKEAIGIFRETLIFLVEQEKIRGEEVSALNAKIESVNETLVNEVINPSIEAYKEDKFREFSDKYGERLGKYDSIIGSAQSTPDYSATREAFNELANLSEEERDKVNIDDYVDGIEKGLVEYVAEIKKSLGLPEDTKVEVTADGDEVKVKADTDGDGTTETVVAEESVTESDDKEEVKEDVEDEESVEIDPELQKDLDSF